MGDTIAALQRLSEPLAPDWTQHNTHDPGIALLELLAWLAESLLYRTGQLTDEGRLYAARVAAAQSCDQLEGGVLNKVRFFEGRLIDEDDLRMEQDYCGLGLGQ